MKKLLILILLVVSSVGGYASCLNKFEIKRGINLSHWLSQRIENGPSIQEGMNETDFNRIARAGFDHVRLPIDEKCCGTKTVKRTKRLSPICIKVSDGRCRTI